MTAKERAAKEAAWRKAYNAVLKDRAALIGATHTEVQRLLTVALGEVKLALASAPSDYQAWYLPQLLAEIEKTLVTMSNQAAGVVSGAADQAWQLGIDTLDKPIAAAGVKLSGLMPHLDMAQQLAMRNFMTDRIRDVGSVARGKINSELGMTMIGARPMSDTITRVQEIMGGESRRRATTIVRTEIGRAYSVAAHERAKQAEDAGAPMDKVWRRSGKLRPRLPHALADGQRVAADQPFHINGHLMMHPHDPTAPASETVNCGCVVLYRPRGWAQTMPDHKPYTDAELALDPRMAEIEEARQTGKSINAAAPVAKRVVHSNLTKVQKADFSKWVTEVAGENYKASNTFNKVGVLPNYVLEDSSVAALKPSGDDLHISDYEVRHGVREAKRKRGAALPADVLANLPGALEGARWFYDETHDNIFSAFEIGEADRIGKAVVHLNYTRKKVAYNALITTGVVQRQNLKEAGYREIGKGLKP